MGTVRIVYSIEFGQSLRIGYKATGSSSPYTYLSTFPEASDSPFEFELTPGIYDIELTTICPNCSGNRYADPEVRTVNVLT